MSWFKFSSEKKLSTICYTILFSIIYIYILDLVLVGGITTESSDFRTSLFQFCAFNSTWIVPVIKIVLIKSFVDYLYFIGIKKV